jgi:hypothetical protein
VSDLAVGVYEFLCEAPGQYCLHPVLHDQPPSQISLRLRSLWVRKWDAWISVLRPSKYVELFFCSSSPEVTVVIFPYRDESNASYRYSIEGNFCTCERCGYYVRPYVNCDAFDEEFIDLTAPDSLWRVRRAVLLRNWI